MGERKIKYSKGKMYFGRIALMFLKNQRKNPNQNNLKLTLNGILIKKKNKKGKKSLRQQSQKRNEGR